MSRLVPSCATVLAFLAVGCGGRVDAGASQTGASGGSAASGSTGTGGSAGASVSVGSGGSTACIPAPGSCDAPPPQMNAFDATHGCLGARVPLTKVCNTSVNRCFPSAGLGLVCAIAPDGSVFVSVMSDNNMLTGSGWHFSQPLSSFPYPAAVPADEQATAEQLDRCRQAECASPCPGVEPLNYQPYPLCVDAGVGAEIACTDANVQMISASNYDQSCKLDSDCVAIADGNACYPCVIACQTGGAINRSALSIYQSDISKTTGAQEAKGVHCGCPASFGPCCRSGVCHADLQCVSDAASE
jgi:hypothetical protein